MQVRPVHLQIGRSIALYGVAAIESDQRLAGGVMTGQHLRRLVGECADLWADAQPVEGFHCIRRE